MKRIFLFFLFFLGINNYAQNKLSFDYDAAGNQILRQWCTGCHSRTTQNVKDFSEIEKDDLEKFHPEDEISYYPNPVKEQLYLQWELTNHKKVTQILLYNLNGQLIKKIEQLENTSNAIFSFSALPQGIYNLILIYNNGEQKNIKIIKNQQ